MNAINSVKDDLITLRSLCSASVPSLRLGRAQTEACLAWDDAKQLHLSTCSNSERVTTQYPQHVWKDVYTTQSLVKTSYDLNTSMISHILGVKEQSQTRRSTSILIWVVRGPNIPHLRHKCMFKACKHGSADRYRMEELLVYGALWWKMYWDAWERATLCTWRPVETSVVTTWRIHTSPPRIIIGCCGCTAANKKWFLR